MEGRVRNQIQEVHKAHTLVVRVWVEAAVQENYTADVVVLWCHKTLCLRERELYQPVDENNTFGVKMNCKNFSTNIILGLSRDFDT